MNLNKTNDIVFRNGGYLQRYEKWFYGDTKLKVVSYVTKKMPTLVSRSGMWALLFCRLIAIVSIESICFIRILAWRLPVIQFQLSALLLVCILFVLFLWFVAVLSGEPRQKQEGGLRDRKVVQGEFKQN